MFLVLMLMAFGAEAKAAYVPPAHVLGGDYKSHFACPQHKTDTHAQSESQRSMGRGKMPGPKCHTCSHQKHMPRWRPYHTGSSYSVLCQPVTFLWFSRGKCTRCFGMIALKLLPAALGGRSLGVGAGRALRRGNHLADGELQVLRTLRRAAASTTTAVGL